MPAKLAFKKRKAKPASDMEEIKRKKILLKCSRTTAEGRASPAELRLSKLKSPKIKVTKMGSIA